MATTNETNGFYKLSWLQRIGFGSGDLAQNLIFQTVATYLMIYLTTVLKINLAFVSGPSAVRSPRTSRCTTDRCGTS